MRRRELRLLLALPMAGLAALAVNQGTLAPSAAQSTRAQAGGAQPPSATIGDGGVEAVVIGSTVRKGGAVTSVPFLLLKDGRAYQEEPASPADFRPASREFGTWGVTGWQRTPSGYRLTSANGGVDELSDAGRLVPASDGFVLQGRYAARGEPERRARGPAAR